MSHYSLAVITDDIEKIDEILEPFKEGDKDEVDMQYLEFLDAEKEYFEEYKNSDCEIKDKYPTFYGYLERWHAISFDETKGVYGYWYNPNAKWDWWTIGGRFSNSLKLKNGGFIDYAKISECDFSQDVDIKRKYKRYWETFVDKEPLNEGEDEFFTLYKPEYYVEKYKNKEIFAESFSSFYTYAVITPDGVWHSIGEMLMFGLSDDYEDLPEWCINWADRFVKPYQDKWIVVIDLHI